MNEQQLSCVLMGNRLVSSEGRQEASLWDAIRKRAKLLVEARTILKKLAFTSYYDVGNVQSLLNHRLQLQRQEGQLKLNQPKHLSSIVQLLTTKLKELSSPAEVSSPFFKRLAEFGRAGECVDGCSFLKFLVEETNSSLQYIERSYFKERLIQGNMGSRVCSVKRKPARQERRQACSLNVNKENSLPCIQEYKLTESKPSEVRCRLKSERPDRPRAQFLIKRQREGLGGMVQFYRREFGKLYKPMEVQRESAGVWQRARTRKELKELLIQESLRRNELG